MRNGVAISLALLVYRLWLVISPVAGLRCPWLGSVSRERACRLPWRCGRCSPVVSKADADVDWADLLDAVRDSGWLLLVGLVRGRDQGGWRVAGCW